MPLDTIVTYIATHRASGENTNSHIHLTVGLGPSFEGKTLPQYFSHTSPLKDKQKFLKGASLL